MEDSMDISLKTRNKTTIWPNNPTTGLISWENHNWKWHMYPDVHCSTIYNSQDMAATWIFIDRWMDKEDVVCVHNGILLSLKRSAFESILMRWVNLEPIIQSEVSQKEKKKILCINACIWNLERWYKWSYVQGHKGDMDVKNRLGLSGRRGWDDLRE